MNKDASALLIVLGTFLLLMFVFFTVSIVIVIRKRRFQQRLNDQQREHDYEQQLLKTRLEVQEQSYKYLSEEIHDNINQLIGLARIQLHNIKNNISDPELVTNITNCNELLAKAVGDLRGISHTLNGNYIDQLGLHDAIKKELEYIGSAKSIQCMFATTGDEYHLNTERELMAFRIVQEAVANAIKHGKPQNIDISLHYKPEKIVLLVEDDGEGFEPETKKTGGMGLQNMRARAEALRCDLKISSGLGLGTTLALDIDREPKLK